MQKNWPKNVAAEIISVLGSLKLRYRPLFCVSKLDFRDFIFFLFPPEVVLT